MEFPFVAFFAYVLLYSVLLGIPLVYMVLLWYISKNDSESIKNHLKQSDDK